MQPLTPVALAMGSLSADTRCGWCGRQGATYIPDGIDPPVPLCGIGPRPCLWGQEDRHGIIFRALRVIFRGAVACCLLLVTAWYTGSVDAGYQHLFTPFPAQVSLE